MEPQADHITDHIIQDGLPSLVLLPWHGMRWDGTCMGCKNETTGPKWSHFCYADSPKQGIIPKLIALTSPEIQFSLHSQEYAGQHQNLISMDGPSPSQEEMSLLSPHNMTSSDIIFSSFYDVFVQPLKTFTFSSALELSSTC